MLSKFSIEDGVYVARSQKSLKVGEKISVENRKIMVFKKWAFFGRKKVVFLGSPGCVPLLWASPGFPGLPGIDFTIKIDFYEKNPESGNLE